jgi:uncharacterized protein (UPF0276 family)
VDSAELPALGVGVVYSSALEPLLERHPELFPVLEVEPQTTWIKIPGAPQPYCVNREVLEHLVRLPGRKIVHSVGTPVGGTVPPEPAQLERLRESIAYLGSPWASDHLSFNQTPEFATGFFPAAAPDTAGPRDGHDFDPRSADGAARADRRGDRSELPAATG